MKNVVTVMYKTIVALENVITVLAEWVWCQVEAGFLVGVLAAATLTGVCFLFRFLELPSAKLDSCKSGVRGHVGTQTYI